jgi:Zn-dependent oligopeptidase
MTNAIPKAIGSGLSTTDTLFHEGGHALHFSSIFMPSPVFSQEFGPTSVAMAETQSMFIDSLTKNPAWLARYAKTEKGEPIPEALIQKFIQMQTRFKAQEIRKMMVVPYTEKMMYELKDSELTPDRLIKNARKIEKELTLLNGSSRPVFIVPHIYEEESSAYYHGYIMAEAGLSQTDNHFMHTYGYVIDNPAVGDQMAEKYWKPGNSKTFFQFIERMTGKPFSPDALVESISKTDAEIAAYVKAGIEWERKTRPSYEASLKNPIDLELNLTVMHGEEKIATTESGQSYEKVGEVFSKWVKRLEKEAESATPPKSE